MKFVTDYRLERYAIDTDWKDYPEDVQRRAVWCAIDLMCALVLGSRGEQFQTGLSLAKGLGLSGEVPVVGSDARFNLLGATIAMGHSSNSFDIDDGFNLIKGHPGTSFIGGLMAAALKQNLTYGDFLTTLVKGYELTIRWALAMQQHYGFLHSTGTYGAFGTALTQGIALGLDEKKLNNALSIADFHAPLTPVMRSVEYPSMNKDGVPFGALVGAMAVLETLAGETGRTHLLELPEFAPLLDSLGEHYYIRELYFKPFTCCRWAHQPILACQTLMKAHGISHEDVDRVVVHTFDAATRLSKIVPSDTDEAQYNIAFPVASALVYGDVGFEQINNRALKDPVVLSMMERLSFQMDPEMEAQFPDKRLAWVEMSLKDGRMLRSEVFAAPGEHTDPTLDLDWFIDKFRRVTSPLLPPEGQAEIVHMLTGDRTQRLHAIVDTINRWLLRHGQAC